MPGRAVDSRAGLMRSGAGYSGAGLADDVRAVPRPGRAVTAWRQWRGPAAAPPAMTTPALWLCGLASLRRRRNGAVRWQWRGPAAL